MSDILDDLRDLHRQATEERSHHYTGSVVQKAIAEIMRLRLLKNASPNTQRDIDIVLAQLRHAYMQLMGGYVINQQEFARGLIAPQIRTLEELR
jgi:hypothetical protein